MAVAVFAALAVAIFAALAVAVFAALAIAVFAAIAKITRIRKDLLTFRTVMFNSSIIIMIIASFTVAAIEFDIVFLAQQDQLVVIIHEFYISYSSTVQLK